MSSGKDVSDISGYIATTSAVTLRKSQCHWSEMMRKADEIIRDFGVGSFHLNYITSALENNYSRTWSCLGKWWARALGKRRPVIRAHDTIEHDRAR